MKTTTSRAAARLALARFAPIRAASMSLSAALLAAAALVGCTPPMDRAELQLESSPPIPVTLTEERITITHGIAAGVTVKPFAQGDEISSAVTMTSSDSSILGVEHVAGNLFIVYGTFPGACTVHITETSTRAIVDVPATVEIQ